MSSTNSDGNLTAAPLLKARGVSLSNQNKVQNGGGEKLKTSTTSAPTTRFQNSATENFLCLRENEKCTRQRMEGFKYCLQHIKPGRESNYRQCNYVSTRNGKRCFKVTVKSETGKEGFCIDHARLVTFYRRRTAYKNRFHDTPDTLLENINRSLTFKISKSDQKSIPSITNRPRLDYYSESSDDETKETVLDTKSAFEDSDMELEETYEPLKHAGIYTAEEVVRLTIEKMTALRDLYVEQLKVLNRKYKIKRQKYLRLVKAEGEAHGPLSVLVRTYKEKKKMEQLRSLRRYSKHFGKEALLHKQSKERQRKANESKTCASKENPNSQKKYCSFCSNEAKCYNEPLPSSSYCLNHILHDERQIIFKKCQKNDCLTPVCQCLPFERCWIHRPVEPVSENDLSLPFKLDIEKSRINVSDKVKTIQKLVGNVSAKESNLPFKFDAEKPKPNIIKESENIKFDQKAVAASGDGSNFPFNNDFEMANVDNNLDNDKLKTKEEDVVIVSEDESSLPLNLDVEKSKKNRKKESDKLQTNQKVADAVLEDKLIVPFKSDVENPKVQSEKDKEILKSGQKIDARSKSSQRQRRSFDSSSRFDPFEQRRSFDHNFSRGSVETSQNLSTSSKASTTTSHRNRGEFFCGNLAAPALLPAKYNEEPLTSSRMPKSSSAGRSSNSDEHSYGRF